MHFFRHVLLMLAISIIFTTSPIMADQSHDKSTVFQLFSDMETAWNTQDSDTYITFFHDDLKLKLGKKNKPEYYSKTKYAKVLPERMKHFGPFKMVDPKILKMDGDSAKASVVVRKIKRDYKNVFNLVWEDGKWQILSNEW